MCTSVGVYILARPVDTSPSTYQWDMKKSNSYSVGSNQAVSVIRLPIGAMLLMDLGGKVHSTAV